MAELSELAAELVEKNQRKTQGLSPIVRSTARTYYAAGIGDCLRIMQEAAIDSAQREQLTPAQTGGILTEPG